MSDPQKPTTDYKVQFLRTPFDVLQTMLVRAQTKEDAKACAKEVYGGTITIKCCIVWPPN